MPDRDDSSCRFRCSSVCSTRTEVSGSDAGQRLSAYSIWPPVAFSRSFRRVRPTRTRPPKLGGVISAVPNDSVLRGRLSGSTYTFRGLLRRHRLNHFVHSALLRFAVLLAAGEQPGRAGYSPVSGEHSQPLEPSEAGGCYWYRCREPDRSAGCGIGSSHPH